MKTRVLPIALLVLVLSILGVVAVQAQGPTGGFSPRGGAGPGTAFTFQGQIKSNNVGYTGLCDFIFGLYDGSVGTIMEGNSPQTKTNVSVTNGYFTVQIDFGGSAFNGESRYLDIQARCPAGSGLYTPLSPRTQLTPAPMAFALPGFYTRYGINPDIIGGFDGNSIGAGVKGSTISGGGDAGYENIIPAGADFSTIGGGVGNQTGDQYATIAGGGVNVASGYGSTIGGGGGNTAHGVYATIPGGLSNLAYGDYSFAAGTKAKANGKGIFTWADSLPYDFNSNTDNSFRVRATGGVRFVLGIDLTNGATTWSCAVFNGDGGWSCSSDRNLKENFVAVDGRATLDRLANVPILRWNAKGGDPNIKHFGPMAQDFYAAFQLGNDDKSISTIDLDGVELSSIQGLYGMLKEKDAEIARLGAQNEAQQKKLVDLESRMAGLEQLAQSNSAGVRADNRWDVGIVVVGALLGLVIMRRSGLGGER